ncbi:MAG: DUF2461 domain-containing protein [Bacteroidia bacterium]|jgi:uncharacterized protein (TIGR02453 family)|uniref:DUF2461 domain-containing protein n=1 Tax=Candidatus Pollutiaquabacter sp. TaxID=3416354 RepID=UPI001A3A596C|nr:DUF2461 domain-containing protein [Bacteroidota bacterium]MBL7949000.1 DUF2461 domain-containing protein [Bacteroidia bacterium]MBP7270464.1 DUF2461 domain-containing protein [Bacteroidia bacterium]MBP7437787.1 DUF2461 domain-containing protein [Bacteroidia bacterium]MBP7727988.1 DUF2461 domain-containing protein [Bacteroidia bacterium]
MTTIQPKTFAFLKALKKNNNRDWFNDHKSEYENAKDNVLGFIQELVVAFSTFDSSLRGLEAKDCLFRIYRDTRFSKDKTPYKTNLGASINAGGKKSMGPGYYVHLEPGGSFIAGGIWMPPADEVKKIRQEIDYNGKDLKKVLTKPSFKKAFGGLSREHALKTAPKGYPKDHPDIELLKLNSFIVWKNVSDKDILGPKSIKTLTTLGKEMKPLMDFLKTALD